MEKTLIFAWVVLYIGVNKFEFLFFCYSKQLLFINDIRQNGVTWDVQSSPVQKIDSIHSMPPGTSQGSQAYIFNWRTILNSLMIILQLKRDLYFFGSHIPSANEWMVSLVTLYLICKLWYARGILHVHFKVYWNCTSVYFVPFLFLMWWSISANGRIPQHTRYG